MCASGGWLTVAAVECWSLLLLVLFPSDLSLYWFDFLLCFYLQIFVLCLVSFAPSSSSCALLQLSSSSVCIASVCLGLGISKCSLKWEERQICPTTKQRELGSCVKSCGLTEQLCVLTGRRSCFFAKALGFRRLVDRRDMGSSLLCFDISVMHGSF